MNASTIIFDTSPNKDKGETKPPVPKKVEEMPSEDVLSIDAQILLEKYRVKLETGRAGASEDLIKVSEVLGSVAFLYERFRNAIDYKGEHLLRRNAIERILRRQIWERIDRDVAKIASSLIKELIWARYAKNDSIPKRKAGEIAKTISRYLEIFNLITPLGEKERGGKLNDVKEWFLGIASAEIEEILDLEVFYLDALNVSVYSWFKKNFEWEGDGLDDFEKDIQILIAVQRTLSKSDNERVRYHLLQRFYPRWEELTEGEIREVIGELLKLRSKIELHFNSPFQPRIYRFVQRQSAAFQIFREVIEEDVEKAKVNLSNPGKLEDKIQKVCSRKYDAIRERVNRGITRSVVYIFASKVLLAFLIEIPFELFFIGGLNFLALGMNTLFPPFLMYLVGLSIKRPDEENTQRIIGKIKSFVYSQKDEKKVKFSLASVNRNKLSYKIFFLFYAVLSFLVFIAITYVLILLNFNILSGTIFFMFLSLVLLFGYRVRYTASELSVTGEREGFVSHLFTNLTLPFLNLGIWLSKGLAKFNFLTVLFDFLFEAPFKRIIGVFEEWTTFIRERREEVVEVPE